MKERHSIIEKLVHTHLPIQKLKARLEKLDQQSFRSALKKSSLTPLESDEILNRTKLNIDSVLADPDLRKTFRSFLVEAYAEENIDFWEAIQKLELALGFAGEKDSKVLKAAFIDKFLDSTSEKQVNLPSQLVRDLKEKSCTREDLLLARKEIEKLMSSNFLVKFLSLIGDDEFEQKEEEENNDDERRKKHAFEIRNIQDLVGLE